ncbi:MAG: acyl-CoA dehydrogenase family protein [Pigmentiphaga sp.]
MNDSQEIRLAFQALIGADIDRIRSEADALGFSADLWSRVQDAGFDTIALPEHLGGSGLELHELAAVLEVAGEYAAPIPIAEANIAALAWAALNEDRPSGWGTVESGVCDHAVQLVPAGNAWLASGYLRRVPWAAQAGYIVFTHAAPASNGASRRLVGIVPAGVCELQEFSNIAGEPEADVRLPAQGVCMVDVESPRAQPLAHLLEGLMLARVSLMTGAMRRIRDLCIGYTSQRQQFGRPIIAFQAVQQQLAEMASLIEQADAMGRLAWGCLGQREAALAAKINAGQAACCAIQAGHQVHGAIGITMEYELQRHTRRLMAWRDYGGSEIASARELGEAMTANGGDHLWQLISA